jgi:hypothetical protein
MDGSHRSPRPVQMPLPLPPPPPPPSPPQLPGPPICPQQVWGNLSPSHRAQVRRVFIALAQEVTRGRDASGEDHARSL